MRSARSATEWVAKNSRSSVLLGGLLGHRLGAVLAELGGVPVPGGGVGPGAALAVEAVDLVEPGQRRGGAAHAHLAQRATHGDGDGRGARGGVGRRLDLHLRLVDVAGGDLPGLVAQSGGHVSQLGEEAHRPILPRGWCAAHRPQGSSGRLAAGESRSRVRRWAPRDRPLLPPGPRRRHGPQPRLHGPAHPAAGRAARRPAVAARGGLLPPARQRRPGHQRGRPDLARGQGVRRHPRHPQPRAGRRVARGHRRRARRGRPHRRPAVAHRPRRPRVAARRRPPRLGDRQAVPVPHQPRRRRRRRLPGRLPDPARPGHRRAAPAGRGLRRRDPLRPRRRLRPRRDPRRPRLPAPPVPQLDRQRPHRRLGRRPRRPAPAAARRRRRGRRRAGPPTGSASASPPSAPSTASRTRTATSPGSPWPASCPRAGSPSCTSPSPTGPAACRSPTRSATSCGRRTTA